MVKGYTNKKEIENYLGAPLDVDLTDESGDESGEESQLNSWLEQAEEIIDNETGRNFKADSVASARLFDGRGSNKLLIDDCVVISKVELGDGNTILKSTEFEETTDYISEPANKTPKQKLINMGYVWPSGRQNVKITAKWGYSVKVPKDITFAATVLAVGIINNTGNIEQTVRSITVGRYTVTYDNSRQLNDLEKVKEILERYKKLYI
jgi:hypothetical protein